MTIHPSLLKKVPEASYLTAENAARYRPIMRHFYQQHGLHRFFLTLEEVRDFVRIHVDPTYSDDLAEQDLSQLVEWGNLRAEQDRGRVRTVDEWLRRRLRYQITPYGIAFERLLSELEEAIGSGGSLDPTNLDSLWHRLTELNAAMEVLDPENQEYLQRVRRLWLDAYTYFDRIGKDASDYLSAMHRSRPDDLNEVEKFLGFKDVLVQYLSSFLNSLADYAEKIQALLVSWQSKEFLARLVTLLVLHDTRYVVDPDGNLPDGAVTRAHYQQQIDALADWFRRGGGADGLRRTTADAIEMVVRHTQRLMERRRFGMSRRRELEELARCFAACRELDQAERLAGLVFGLASPRHLQGSLEAHAMADRQSVWVSPPMEIPLGRIKRGRQAKAKSAPMRDVIAEQQAVLIEEMERRQQEAALWDRLFSLGDVNLGELTVDDPALRGRLLELVGRCLASPDQTALASDGSYIRLLPPSTRQVGELVSPDGVLYMPRFILRRERERGAGR
jgi:uncharacterized protein (TIGR02677 family)